MYPATQLIILVAAALCFWLSSENRLLTLAHAECQAEIKRAKPAGPKMKCEPYTERVHQDTAITEFCIQTTYSDLKDK